MNSLWLSMYTPEIDNLVIVDTHAFQYYLVELLKSTNTSDRTSIERFTTNSLIYMLSGAWLNSINKTPITFLWVSDLKPYWRHYELGKLGVNYKGNRFKDSRRDETLAIINTTTQYFLKKNDINILQHGEYNKEGVLIGYEADDLAAIFIRDFGHTCKQVYTLTVDTDWLPFTHRKNVEWLGITTVERMRRNGTYNYAPRIRNQETACKWWSQNTDANSSHTRALFPKDNILDLWRFKADFGDKSDNLRGNIKDQSPGRYNSVVDLWQPPSQYDLADKIIYNPYLSKPFKSVSIQDYKKMGGVIIPIQPFTNSDRTSRNELNVLVA